MDKGPDIFVRWVWRKIPFKTLGIFRRGAEGNPNFADFFVTFFFLKGGIPPLQKNCKVVFDLLPKTTSKVLGWSRIYYLRRRNPKTARADSAWRRSASKGKCGVLETMVKVGCKKWISDVKKLVNKSGNHICNFVELLQLSWRLLLWCSMRQVWVQWSPGFLLS